MTTYPARTRRWTREEYGRLIEIGVFRPGEPVELLGGELVVSEPQGSAHYTAIGLVEAAGTTAARIPRSPLSSWRSRSRASPSTASTKAVSTPGLVWTTIGS